MWLKDCYKRYFRYWSILFGLPNDDCASRRRKSVSAGLSRWCLEECTGQKKPWANPRQTTERGEAFRLRVYFWSIVQMDRDRWHQIIIIFTGGLCSNLQNVLSWPSGSFRATTEITDDVEGIAVYADQWTGASFRRIKNVFHWSSSLS